jgi:hypothetical protein
MVDDGGGRISLGAVAFILLSALKLNAEFYDNDFAVLGGIHSVVTSGS